MINKTDAPSQNRQTKVADDTPNCLLNVRIWRMLSSRLPDRISETTSWLPISVKSFCLSPCLLHEEFERIDVGCIG
jgi:hypothetical protein